MKKQKLFYPVIIIAALLLSVAVYRSYRSTLVEKSAKKTLMVGFLPVTCHLTCPVTDFASSKNPDYRFLSNRFTDFPTMAEAFKAGKLKAAFFIAPMAMKIREQGVKAKIVYLGHRDGSTVIVKKDSKAKSLKDLRGLRFAVPSKFSNQYLVITKLMQDEGVNPEDMKFMEVAPPEMPSALANGAIDAYFIGEPHAAKAELAGTGRILYHAKDIWPGFISCVLIVSEELMKEDPDVVRELVKGIAESGEWAEHNRLKAAELAAPYFRQDEKLLRYVLTTPKDRVSYSQLFPKAEEIKLIHDMAIESGILQKPIELSELIDTSFAPTEIAKKDIF